MLEKLFPGQVAFGNALCLEHGHDLGFCGNGGMVNAWHPARSLAFHARLAHQDILDGIVQHMPHV